MMLRLTVMVLSVVLLSGCIFSSGKEKCHKPQEYQQAKPAPRVRVPDGMTPLPDSSRLPVPYGEAQSEAIPKDEPCLIEPPGYYDQPVG